MRWGRSEISARVADEEDTNSGLVLSRTHAEILVDTSQFSGGDRLAVEDCGRGKWSEERGRKGDLNEIRRAYS